MTPPLVTPLVDNGVTMEEALTRIVDSRGEQKEQMTKRMSELERTVHVERENLREKINRNRQEVRRREKRFKKSTDEYLAKNLSRMTREAEERERRLTGDLEQLRSQQEQALGTLDTGRDAMMERRTQAIMDRLDGLVVNRSNSRNRGSHSEEADREPIINFNDRPNRGRTHGSTGGRDNSSINANGDNREGVQRIPEEVLLVVGRYRVNVLCEKRMRVKEAIPQAATTRIKENLSPAIWTEGKRIITIKRDIRVMQRQ